MTATPPALTRCTSEPRRRSAASQNEQVGTLTRSFWPRRSVDHDRSRNAEVERLKGVGATVYEDHRKPDGTGWVTMADPVGNLLCVERSAGEHV
jgi:hypothetical protein